MKHKYDELMENLRKTRKALIAPESNEDAFVAQAMAIEIFKSTEFGNFLTLSTIYNELEKAK